LRNLTPDERSAYAIWQSKLKDRTLSAAQHDEARRKIDELLWKGPNAQVLALKAEIAALVARVERLEFHAGLNDEVLPVDVHASHKDCCRTRRGNIADQTGLNQSVDAVTGPPVGDVILDQSLTTVELAPNPPAPETETVVPQPEPVEKETRGRKKLRFIPDKNATGGWMLLDREAGADGEYLDAAPFKTRKEAKSFTDDLNAGRVPTFLKGKFSFAAEAGENAAEVDEALGENPHDTENAPDDISDIGF
jgi:hypothetical protein